MTLTDTERLAFSTVRIETRYEDGTGGTGTGFFFHFPAKEPGHVIPAIVTNRHVVDGAPFGKIHLTLRDEDGGPAIGRHHAVGIDNFGPAWVGHPDPEVDLCVFPFNSLLRHLDSKGLRFFYVPLEEWLILTDEEREDLTALEEILMIGYPTGIWDSTNNMPIFRRGITATHARLDYKGRKEFLIDAACFPGSSGSPVFLYNQGVWATRQGGTVGGTRLRLLGLLYAGPMYTREGEIRVVTVPTQQRAISVSTHPINLGVVIRAERLKEMRDALHEHIARAETP